LTFRFKKNRQIEDPGADLLDQVTSWLDRYGRMALVGVGIVVVAAVAVFLGARARTAAEGQAASMLAEASVLYWQGEYEQSLTLARQVNEQFPSTPSGIDALRLAGDNAYWNGDFEAAVTEYRNYIGREKRKLLADAARRSLAYALESDGKLEEAATAFENLVGTFDRESSAEFLAAAARCYRALGRPQDAAIRLQRLLDEFGETSLANAARLDLAEIQTGTG